MRVRVVRSVYVREAAQLKVIGPSESKVFRGAPRHLETRWIGILPTQSFRRPDGKEPQEFSFHVWFPSNQQDINVKARVAGLQEVSMTQLEATYVKLDLHHLYTSATSLEQQCTVTCLKSGETRTGHHPCIECTVGGVTVRLCC